MKEMPTAIDDITEDTKMGLLDRLDKGEVILGDGSYVMTLESRGYVKAGDWTPQAACEYPDAVKELGLEFARAGADITQTFTFWSQDDKLPKDCKFTCREINQSACDIAKSICKVRGTALAGGITQTEVFLTKRDREAVRDELRCAITALIENDVELVIVEYFHHIQEMEWAIEFAMEYGKPVAATMCMGPTGDGDGVPPGECAVRMARAGASIVGVNCLFDPYITLETMALMKEALDKEGLKPHLMCQALGFMTQDARQLPYGYVDLPEFPFALDNRTISRWDACAYARGAYELGVRYIGGCCGFQPYHIRAMAEELRHERGGKMAEASAKSDYDLERHKQRETANRPDAYKDKGSKKFWMDLVAKRRE